ncbi:type II toxin-antitoxin system RelE family toxin [Candidatus Jidaibacter acanthamoebae]|nr:type II toxin-antitoxin system RelE/ParE family toxin [Candidatus Jidaibacter acanthamoeba]
MVDPIGFSKPLHYKIGGYVSDYRIVYRIKYKTTTVVIVAIKHRKEVYEGN